ncbi:MAG TPA: hypothetical protein VGP06_03130, partial [Janthinobacterium sp.]|nr:hypothetical protein [Janthinobacterium sp.]
MHGEPELLRQVRARLWLAMLRRRAPLWLLVLLPWLLLPLALLLAPLLAAPAPSWQPAAGAGVLAWVLWLAVDMRMLRRRLAGRWTSWLDAAVPALEDSSGLLAGPVNPVAGAPAAEPALAALQRRRILARLLPALDAADYRRIARSGVAFQLVPLVLSTAAAA